MKDEVTTMSRNAYYGNKQWVRKAMTILLDKMVMFKTVDRRENEGKPFGEFELGLEFSTREQGPIIIWPTCESDLNEIRCIISCY
jgi:hypothetical protein